MKLSTQKVLALFGIVAALSFPLPFQTAAQTFTNLYSFSAFDPPSSWFNSDGGWPTGGVILSGNTLFATTVYGSSYGWGTVFAVNTDGSGFTSLYQFSGGSDGKWPSPGMVLSSNTLYGATIGGGNGVGNIFAVNTDGSGFADLYDFTLTPSFGFRTNSDGSVPGYLAVSGDTLYGVASEGGLYANGTLFSLNIDGSGFTTLHTFAANGVQSGDLGYPNNDGAGPSWLIVSGGTLYGTAGGGGHSGYGTVFKLNSDGTGFTVLHHFTAPKGSLGYYGTNTDGAGPGNLILSGNKIYGTTFAGGVTGHGTLFSVNTDGTGFAVLYSGDLLFGPKANLVASGNTLYWWSWGNVCAVSIDGSGLISFPTGGPSLAAGGLIMSGHTLYGLLPHGGDWGNGAVFSCLVPPRLSLTAVGGNLRLAWPTNYSDYVLQLANVLANGGDWHDLSVVPTQTNGQNLVSISTSGSPSFFRLRHP